MSQIYWRCPKFSSKSRRKKLLHCVSVVSDQCSGIFVSSFYLSHPQKCWNWQRDLFFGMQALLPGPGVPKVALKWWSAFFTCHFEVFRQSSFWISLPFWRKKRPQPWTMTTQCTLLLRNWPRSAVRWETVASKHLVPERWNCCCARSPELRECLKQLDANLITCVLSLFTLAAGRCLVIWLSFRSCQFAWFD